MYGLQERKQVRMSWHERNAGQIAEMNLLIIAQPIAVVLLLARPYLTDPVWSIKGLVRQPRRLG